MIISKTLILTIILLIIGLARVWKEPVIGLYAFVFVLITRPWYNHSELLMLHLPLTISIITLIALFIKSRAAESPNLRVDLQLKLMILFYVWMFLSIGFNGSNPLGNRWITSFYKIIVLYFILINTLNSEERMVRFFWVWVGIYFYLSFLGLSKYSDGIHWNTRPYLWMHKNGWGPSVSIIVPMAVALFWRPSLWRFSRKSDLPVGACMVFAVAAILWHHMMLVSLAMIVGTVIVFVSAQGDIRKWFEKSIAGLTVLATVAAGLWGGSRSGFIATISSGALSVFLQLRSPKRMVVSLLVVGALMGYIGVDHLNKMYTSITEHTEDQSTLSRLVVWETSMEIIKNNPLFGVGVGMFTTSEEAVETFEEVGGVMNVHNSFLQLAVEMGLPGAALFIIMLLRSIFLAFRLSLMKLPSELLENESLTDVKYYARYIPVCIAAYAINMFFHNAAYGINIYIIIGIVSALESIIRTRESVAIHIDNS